MAGVAEDRESKALARKPRRVLYRQRARWIAGMFLAFTPIPFLTLIVVSAAGFVLTGLILAGAGFLADAALVAALSPQMMLREDLIRIWHGFRFTNIGVSEIAGVGLLYTHVAGYGGDWRLAIWRDDGSRQDTACRYRPRRELAPGRKQPRWVRQAAYDPVAASEIPALEASRAAAVARDICRRVLAAQGPAGQLATRHLEKHEHPLRTAAFTQVIAYWSPDGQAGRCH